MRRTRLYIDGFNLYYGAIRRNRAHWLDLEAFGRHLNDGEAVDHIVYCTAMVSASADDPDGPNRQDAYHRALRAGCPSVEILKGNFASRIKTLPVARCCESPPCCALVDVWEEKGSDVNLGTRLVHDAHCGRFDQALVVTGDSDLAEPVRLVVHEVKLPVYVWNPRGSQNDTPPSTKRRRGGSKLRMFATGYATIPDDAVTQSQLPSPLVVNGMIYRKPAKWSEPPPARRLRHDTLCDHHKCTAIRCRQIAK